MTLLLATRNPKKVHELRRLLKGVPVRFLTLGQFPDIPAVEEDGKTFRSNALKKAMIPSRSTILPVLAEDSGLEVRALGGAPGVRSARYAGADQDDAGNVAKLLKVLKKFPRSQRQARFVCSMVLAAGGKPIGIFEGSCAGWISFSARGKTGFGYDPVFIPAGRQKTMADLGPRLKDRLSHRAQAARKLKAWLRANPSAGPGGSRAAR
ncbi:MAG: RdgB/HAM1 family non-canonical purine NTP pyrophosphatase [Candidatus Omnitrophica bacterium]|nr:RdgB/HAM1 family non-canonical purine NTP pyrophosphatase [Candidatus Omnitrophota bacterium]